MKMLSTLIGLMTAAALTGGTASAQIPNLISKGDDRGGRAISADAQVIAISDRKAERRQHRMGREGRMKRPGRDGRKFDRGGRRGRDHVNRDRRHRNDKRGHRYRGDDSYHVWEKRKRHHKRKFRKRHNRFYGGFHYYGGHRPYRYYRGYRPYSRFYNRHRFYGGYGSYFSLFIGHPGSYYTYGGEYYDHYWHRRHAHSHGYDIRYYSDCGNCGGNGFFGAVVGGLVGGVIGAEIDGGYDKTAGAVIGAGVGALAGYEITRDRGHYNPDHGHDYDDDRRGYYGGQDSRSSTYYGRIKDRPLRNNDRVGACLSYRYENGRYICTQRASPE